MFKHVFFKFLDVSGILLGVFLVVLGWWLIRGNNLPIGVGWILLIVGVGAFLTHLGHYFDLKYMRWIFGEEYFVTKKLKRANFKVEP